MQITILIGTMHGNATHVAQALELSQGDLGISFTLLPMDGLNIGVFDAPGPFLLCTSTTGSGDVPDNAQALYQSLDHDARYLGHVRFGLIALGDSSYQDSFCGGGKRFDERLRDLGAQRIGPALELDAGGSNAPEDQAIAWCAEWVKLLSASPQHT
ncbi:flavodoxin domain-containing protein [Rhodoferax aquaticus]|uniref:Nitric oxide synthase n=1 Tax=Rhodoferax aquaticus TaxID=2527691 RepID=A0A515EPD8_9BURK|nr:flavodoxin domain-containing protein [Rhodoferax aquaticus]QDL54526.1 nitric oxide synthase [Rhodoferax aquaticus]